MMNIADSMKLLKKYSKCPDCGSDKVSNGEGTYSIDGNTFVQTCKCGFEIEVVVDEPL